jgi:hypothetical protein
MDKAYVTYCTRAPGRIVRYVIAVGRTYVRYCRLVEAVKACSCIGSLPQFHNMGGPQADSLRGQLIPKIGDTTSFRGYDLEMFTR